MKKTLIFLTLLFAVISLQAQILTPVKWAYAAKRTGKNEAVILVKATIDEGWHIYDLDVPEGGPVKTTFTFKKDERFRLAGKTTTPKPITKFEKVFGMNVSYFKHSVVFQQRVRLSSSGPIILRGTVEYMTCNDQKCLPPEQVDFSITIL